MRKSQLHYIIHITQIVSRYVT